MSFGVDVNILLYASDRSSPLHDKAKAFVQGMVAGTGVFCIAWLTVMRYLRMATHPAIFAQPMSPQDASANMQALLSVPHCRALAEEAGFWAVYQAVTTGLAVRGNLVPDAHLAAVLRGDRSCRLTEV